MLIKTPMMMMMMMMGEILDISYIPQVYDSPEISSEPHCGATVSLVLPDQYGVGYW